MIKKKKILVAEEMPEFEKGIESMPEDSKIFVDKSLEIAHYILELMEQRGIKQKDLAAKMGKSEAEVSKLLAGMHNYTLRSLAKIEAALGATVVCTPVKQKHVFQNGFILKGSYVTSEMKHATKTSNGLDYSGAKLIYMDSKKTEQLVS